MFNPKVSLVSYMRTPRIAPWIIRYRETLTQDSALRLVIALHLYRIERGRYPENLEKLRDVGLTTECHNYLSNAGRFAYSVAQGEAHLAAPIDAVYVDKLRLSGPEWTLLPYEGPFWSNHYYLPDLYDRP